MKNKLIELKGVGTANKGAHLMLLSILSEFKNRNRKAEFCTEPGFGMNYFEAAKYGLHLKLNFKGKKLPWNRLMGLLSQKTRKSYGLTLDKEVEIILDGSGFAYGDYWGAQKIEKRLENHLKGKTSPTCKLVLLPQAFGPFEKPKVKAAFQKVVERADLIFARDQVSYKYLTETYGTKSHIKLAPDFTNLLSSGYPEPFREGNVAIIPNYKMMPSEGKKQHYYNFLKEAIEFVQETGKKPYFLIHEGERDNAIASDLNEKLAQSIPIVFINDPLEIKRRIKSSDFIIVSRFHGLVSALSQKVPALSTSWSHKYQELMKDYKQEQNLIDIEDYKSEDLENKIKDFAELDLKKYTLDQERVVDMQKKRSSEMWDEIFSLIYGK